MILPTQIKISFVYVHPHIVINCQGVCGVFVFAYVTRRRFDTRRRPSIRLVDFSGAPTDHMAPLSSRYHHTRQLSGFSPSLFHLTKISVR